MVDPVIICSMRFLQYYYVSGKVQNRKEANLIRTLHFKYNFSEVDIKFMLWRIQDLIYEAAKVASYIVFFFLSPKVGEPTYYFVICSQKLRYWTDGEGCTSLPLLHPHPTPPNPPTLWPNCLIFSSNISYWDFTDNSSSGSRDSEKEGQETWNLFSRLRQPSFCKPNWWTLSLDPLLNSY